MSKWFVYILLIVSTYLLSVSYNQYSSFVLLLVVVIFPLINYYMLLFIKRKLNCSLELSNDVVHKGENARINLHIVNESRYLSISYGYVLLNIKNQMTNKRYQEKVFFSVKSKDEVNVHISITTEHCGVLLVECKRIRFFDLIHLFHIDYFNSRKAKDNKNCLDIEVFPQIAKVDMDRENNMVDGDFDSDLYSKFKRGEDASEVFEIREYSEGDKIQKIHWKLSASKNNAMVKEYSLPIKCQTMIMIDLNKSKRKNKYEYLDSILSIAMTLSTSLLYGGVLHYICWYESKEMKCKRFLIQQEEDIYEAFSGLLSVNQSYPLMQFYDEYMFEFRHDHLSYIYFVSEKQQEDTFYPILFRNVAERIHTIQPYQEKVERENVLDEEFSNSFVRLTSFQDDIKKIQF